MNSIILIVPVVRRLTHSGEILTHGVVQENVWKASLKVDLYIRIPCSILCGGWNDASKLVFIWSNFTESNTWKIFMVTNCGPDFFSCRCFFMRPQWGWWLVPVPHAHTSCWSTTSGAGHTAPTQPVRSLNWFSRIAFKSNIHTQSVPLAAGSGPVSLWSFLILTINGKTEKLAANSPRGKNVFTNTPKGNGHLTFSFFSFSLPAAVRRWMRPGWEGEGSRHPPGLPPPAHASANPARAPCPPAGRGQAHPGACGRPAVPAGLSADPATPQRGHDHRCLLNMHTHTHTHIHRLGLLNRTTNLVIFSYRYKDANQATHPPTTCNPIIFRPFTPLYRQKTMDIKTLVQTATLLSHTYSW